MAIEVENAADLSGRLVGIIWGMAKTGKTTWSCSLPGKKLLINFDPDGFSAVAYRNDVDVINLANMTAKEAISSALKVGQYIVDNADKYESVIVDSLTSLTDLSLEDAVLRKVGSSPKFNPTIETPGLAGWGARNSTVKMIITKILRATGQNKQNCFFIAHADDPEYSTDGKTAILQTIMLSAKIRNSAGLKVSEIYYLNLDNGKRTVHVAPYGIRQPMGSRMFATETFKKFVLTYNIDKSDEEQNCSLGSILKAWTAGGFKKLNALPK